MNSLQLVIVCSCGRYICKSCLFAVWSVIVFCFMIVLFDSSVIVSVFGPGIVTGKQIGRAHV